MTFDLKRALRKKAKRDAELEIIRCKLLGCLCHSWAEDLNDMQEKAKNDIANHAVECIGNFAYIMNCRPSSVDFCLSPDPKITKAGNDWNLSMHRNTISRYHKYDKYGKPLHGTIG